MATTTAPAVPLGADPSPPHGTKRAAERAPDGEQTRLTRRFDALQIHNHKNKNKIPKTVSVSNGTTPTPTPTITACEPLPPQRRRHRSRLSANDDSMSVDETPHRVYISDLSAELSDVESDDERPVFLADIERHLSKIPRAVLMGGGGGSQPTSTEHNQMVLYNVPASLSVPETQDSVRKAIVEARQRIRAGQASPVVEVGAVRGAPDAGAGPGPLATASTVSGSAAPQRIMPADPDAMDID